MTEKPTGDLYDSTRKGWEDIWAESSVEVELEAIQTERAQETLHAYLPYIDKNEIVLEAGSGLSAVVITLQQMGYRVVGMDYAENALHDSLVYDPSLTLYAGDVHALPHPDNSLGAYLSFGVLEHFEQGMQPALAEVHRILKPSGVVIMTIPYPNIVNKMVKWKRRRIGGTGLRDDEFFDSEYTQHDLERELMEAGFHVELLKPVSHSFTLWGLGSPFRSEGYYQTSALAEGLGKILSRTLRWTFSFETLAIGRKL